jgi:hypothetical protein
MSGGIKCSIAGEIRTQKRTTLLVKVNKGKAIPVTGCEGT